MFAKNTTSTDDKDAISNLLERHKAMRSEIDVLDKLIRDKYEKLARIKQQEGDRMPKEWKEADVVTPAAASCEAKLDTFVREMGDIERLTTEQGLDDELVDEYIDELSDKYDHVLILGPEEVRKLQHASNDTLLNFLDTKLIAKYRTILFVLKDGGHYSLLSFNSSDASFYHFDTVRKCHSYLAEQIALKLRRYLEADQLVCATCESTNVPTSLLTIDNIMKVTMIAGLADEYSVPFVQILKLPSQADCFQVLLMNWRILTKLKRIANQTQDIK